MGTGRKLQHLYEDSGSTRTRNFKLKVYYGYRIAKPPEPGFYPGEAMSGKMIRFMMTSGPNNIEISFYTNQSVYFIRNNYTLSLMDVEFTNRAIRAQGSRASSGQLVALWES